MAEAQHSLVSKKSPYRTEVSCPFCPREMFTLEKLGWHELPVLCAMLMVLFCKSPRHFLAVNALQSSSKYEECVAL